MYKPHKKEPISERVRWNPERYRFLKEVPIIVEMHSYEAFRKLHVEFVHPSYKNELNLACLINSDSYVYGQYSLLTIYC